MYYKSNISILYVLFFVGILCGLMDIIIDNQDVKKPASKMKRVYFVKQGYYAARFLAAKSQLTNAQNAAM